MGYQQLLLLILALILVMAAIAVATNIFGANAVDKNRDYILIDCINVSNMAQQYYKKPASMGGGGSSYLGFSNRVPQILKQNKNGTLTFIESRSSIQLIGSGKEIGNDGINVVKVQMNIRPDTMWTTVLN